MREWKRKKQPALCAVALAGALLSLSPIGFVALPQGAAAQAQEADSAAAKAQAKLNKKEFSNVKVTVDNGIATLTGTVDLYEYKADAQKKVAHVKGVTSVRNQIDVAGPSVSDADLRSKLGEKLEYDRVGYGNTFDAITLGVENGVVTLGGHSHNYVDRDSALAAVSTFPGVKDVVDEIEVDPTSLMDDQTRMAVARAVYGYGSLNRYAINPGQPIRISVQNGHVELYGMVDSQADKDTAGLRANTVPGVFSVKNNLQVANQPGPEAHK
jgi:osmotically-inducible protein OsmY